MEFTAVCGVCHDSITWTQAGDKSWGSFQLDDQGCVSVTVQDPSGEVTRHMSNHHADGTYVEAHKKLIIQQGERFKNLTERGLLPHPMNEPKMGPPNPPNPPGHRPFG